MAESYTISTSVHNFQQQTHWFWQD